MLILIFCPAVCAQGAWVLDKQWTKEEKTAGAIRTITTSLTSSSQSVQRIKHCSCTCEGSWNAPPRVMKPGDAVTFSWKASCKGSCYKGGYYHGDGGTISLYISRLDARGKVTSGYDSGLEWCKAWLKPKTSASASCKREWTVPDGQRAAGLELCITFHGPGGQSRAFFQYVFRGPDEIPSADAPAPADDGTPQPSKNPKPLCKQAQQAYGLPADPTCMRFDLADLQSQFSAAVARYQAETGKKPFLRHMDLRTLPAIGWLANQGGFTDSLNKQFVLTTDDQRSHIRANQYRLDKAPKGTELHLYAEIANEAGRLKRAISPGEVLHLALRERDGNINEACLLAHNTLRSLARLSFNPIHGKGDTDYTMVPYLPNYIDQHLQPVIDPAPLGQAQNTGAWYHLFGVAFFEMQALGDQRENHYHALTQFGSTPLRDLTLAIDKLVKTKSDQRMVLSRIANEVEQAARKHLFGSPDDPMKYCYNIYGAQLGAWLYDSLSPKHGQTTPLQHLDKHWGSGLMEQSIVLGRKLRQGLEKTAWRIRTFISGSPVNIRWRGSGYTMTLDQRAQELSGYYPVHILPFVKSGSWGLVWVDISASPATMDFEAVSQGTHIFAITDGQGNERVYRFPVSAGDRYRLTAGPDGLSALVRPNGAVIPQLSAAQPETLSTHNKYRVRNTPRTAATFTFTEKRRLLFLGTYHWNSGKGTAAPGRIGLRHTDGTIYGLWPAQGRSGQGGVPNAYWEVHPDIVIKPGTYTVMDSQPATWAANPQSGWKGFAKIVTKPE